MRTLLKHTSYGWLQKREVERRHVTEEEQEQVIDVTDCPKCEEITEQQILRRTQKGEGEDLLVKCIICNSVQTIHLRPGKPVIIDANLSDGATSESAKIDSDEDEEIYVNDVFEYQDKVYRITRIDDNEGRPMKRSNAGKIGTLWAVRCDKVVVRITMTDGENSTSKNIECDQNEIFSCGSIMEIDGVKWRIRALHTGKGRTLRGKRSAFEIRRIYLHTPNFRDYRN